MPEVASVGLTEAEAKKRGHDVKVGRFNFGNIAKPRIIGQDFGLVKVVSESKYDEVLGVHMVGPHVTDLISEACVALRLESTVEELMRTIHPHSHAAGGPHAGGGSGLRPRDRCVSRAINAGLLNIGWFK